MVSSEAKNGFNCVSCGTFPGEARPARHSPKRPESGSPDLQVYRMRLGRGPKLLIEADLRRGARSN